MFRARVAAQAFTVLAIVGGGMYYAEDREKRKELTKLKQQHEAEEKRQKWIRELEVRDEEDKALQEMLEKKRKRVAERKSDAETGTDGVAAQARAALKAVKERAAKENGAMDGAAADPPDQPVEGKGKPSSGTLGSLGSWFGGASKAQGDSAEEPRAEKTTSGDARE